MAISTIGTNSISGLGYGFKNRIINGAMMIDQRNAGASVTNGGYVSVDRFFIGNAATTSQRITGNAPTGFSHYLKLTKNAGASVDVRQTIELPSAGQAGEFYVGSKWTLSFWAKSASGGETLTFYSYFRQGVATGTATNISAPATPTITLSTGWALYTTTFTIDASPSGSDLCVAFRLDTTATELHLTGVQLEKGSTATSFDYRPYGTELALCQRYFEKIGGDAAYDIAAAAYTNTDYLYFTVYYKATKRATPTVTKVGTWSTMTAGQPTVIGAGTNSAGMQTVGTTNGRTMVFTSGTSTYVTAEAEL